MALGSLATLKTGPAGRLDSKARDRRKRSARARNPVDHLHVGAPDIAADVEDLIAATGVEQLAVRVVGRRAVPLVRDRHAVAAGADRGRDELGRDRRTVPRALARWQDAGMVLVHIAGGDHDIGQLPRLDHRDQALAAGGIAAPAVEIGAAGAARVGIQERHHHDLLGQQVLALAAIQPLLQPGRLGVAQDRRARRGVQRQAAVQRLGPADLAAAELAGVQHLDAQQVAPSRSGDACAPRRRPGTTNGA